jgi:hypothetical protein
MKILNTDFNESLVWSFEDRFNLLKRVNPKLTDKEIISALKQNGISKVTTKSAKRKADDSASFGNTDNIQ